jgi:muramoyltetrapeptide carboxypeptidase
LPILKPSPLKPGDTIGILSPAGPLYGDKLNDYEKGLAYLVQCGYRVLEGRAVRDLNGYLAGSDEDRAHDFNGLFDNPDVKAIICSRGGYGSARILSKIDYETVRKNPKIFVGYSDLTVLQLALYQKCGLVTFSGPMVAMDLGRDLEPATEFSFWQQVTLAGEHSFIMQEMGALPIVYRNGCAEGRLLGGCLTSLNNLVGTGYLPDFTDCILILEDIAEEIYKIDRYLAQLLQAGILGQVRGLVFGQFIDCDQPQDMKPSLSLDEVFRYYADQLHIPAMANFPYGHGRVKFTLPMGGRVRMDTFKGEIKMLETGLDDDRKD